MRYFLVSSLSLLILGGCVNPAPSEATQPRAQAERVISNVIEARGGETVRLPESNFVATGRLGYRYVPESEQVIVSVLLMEFTAWTLFPDRRPKIEQTLAALNDPAIGGLFESGETEWNFDRESGRLFMTISHDLPVTERQLRSSISELERLAPDWELHWIGAIGDIVHEGAPVPTEPVTVANNPYRRN